MASRWDQRDWGTLFTPTETISNVVTKNGRVLQTRFVSRIEGGPQLAMALMALERSVSGEIAKGAVGAGLAEIQKEWQRRVPVLDRNYQRAIVIKVGRSRTGASGTVSVRRLDDVVTRGNETAAEAQPYLYAPGLEFGRSGYIRRFGGSRRQQVAPSMRSHPAARPAFDHAKGRAVDAVGDRLRVNIAAATVVGRLVTR